MNRHILTVMLRTLIVLATLPFYGDQLRAQFIEGIDVSHWQGTINWNSVKNAGIDFAFAKATQGNNFVDSQFHDNMQAATAAGVLIGPYHFADIDTDINNPLDPINEANHFLNVIRPFYDSGMYLPPVADVEGLPDFPTIAEERAFISNWVQIFSDTINTALGVRPFIYSSKWSANNHYTSSVASTHDLWLAWWKGTGTTAPPHLLRYAAME
jgi:lysozyme